MMNKEAINFGFKKSKCTLGLLMESATAAYRIKDNNIIDPTESHNSYQSTLNAIAQDDHNYAITKTISPKQMGGTGTSTLGAVCLEPQDNTSPIIISYRGTKLGKDVGSDIKLGVTGVVEKDLRDDAYNFYQEVRAMHPGREIILTGHSLGGHLAQYVGAKAYNEAYKDVSDVNKKEVSGDRAYQMNKDLVNNRLLQVRAFNTAPVDTAHADNLFKKDPSMQAQFINYRLSTDLVSKLKLKFYYGTTFIIHSTKNLFSAHPMGALKKAIPEDMQAQVIGGATPYESAKNRLLETTQGMLISYEHRIEGQYFSNHRVGKTTNLPLMKEYINAAAADIQNDNYEAALFKLNTLKNSEQLKGNVSNGQIELLINKVERLSEKYQAEQVAKQEQTKDESETASQVAAQNPVESVNQAQDAVPFMQPLDAAESPPKFAMQALDDEHTEAVEPEFSNDSPRNE